MQIDLSDYQEVFDEILSPNETAEQFVWSAIRLAIGRRSENIAKMKFMDAKRALAQQVLGYVEEMPHGDAPYSIKIARIKAYMNLTDEQGLKEAKDWVESAFSQNGSGEIL